MREKKHVVCSVCDGHCLLEVEVENRDIVAMRGFPNPSVICSKPLHWREYCNHPKRLLAPLKNIGKRGEQKWQTISWDQALDEIAEKFGIAQVAKLPIDPAFARACDAGQVETLRPDSMREFCDFIERGAY